MLVVASPLSMTGMMDNNLIVWERRMMKEMGQEENRVSISMEDLKDKCISGGNLDEPEVVALCQDNDFQIAGQDSGSYEFDAVHCFRCLDDGRYIMATYLESLSELREDEYPSQNGKVVSLRWMEGSGRGMVEAVDSQGYVECTFNCGLLPRTFWP